jgi:transcriptional regulator with AAA-type ATPase domain/tetratricopeptide (TPR) repeat protein
VDPLAQILGESPGIVAVREQVRRLLQRQAGSGRLPAILIQGATGTGKGLVARAMHGASGRAQGPFIDVNCAAIPETLLESEMFGVERGAFTDARQSKPGLFQLAHRGTIFLDEIGLLPEALQAKLLKVIEERSVRRLGGTRNEPVDVWVIAATNEDLAAATRVGRFRADLYHRLAVVTFALPALSQRGDDVLLLAEHFLARACADYGIPPKTLTSAARTALRAHAWPGNIRELANLMERVALLAEDAQVTPAVLALPAAAPAERAPGPGAGARTLEAAVDDVEREHLLAALGETRWNVTRAAARLGISRNTLRYRIEKHGLAPGMARPRRRGGGAPAPEPAATRPAPPPAAPVPTRERRRLTLLRATVITEPGPVTRVPPFGVLDLLADKVLAFGGRVVELNPSGAVAVFGLEPVEDAPIRAAHAAMAIVNGVERARLTDRAGVGVRLGIHVDQFMVQAGHVPTLDLDARLHAWTFLESLVARVEPGGIAVSEAAAPFLERRFNLVPGVGPTSDVGHVFRLAGRERAAPGLRLGGHLTRFVGRQHELHLLRSRFDLAVRGQGQIVGITGEPGIGKSRLLHEFRQSLADQPVACLVGQCASYASSIPFLPVIEGLQIACGIAPTDEPERAAEKVRLALLAVGLPPGEGAPYLLQLLGLKDGEVAGVPLTPEALKSGIFETLRELAIRNSRSQPLVLVLEDLQWIDETSAELFASIVEVVPSTRILLLATYRPGFRPPWIEKSYATQMALQPLLPEESLSVVRSLVGGMDVSERVVQAILAKAEGNALFLEELARSVSEQGASAAVPAVPDTVQEVLLARIDRLPPEEGHLLRAAAVIGKDVPFRLIEAVAGIPVDMVRQGLGHLRAAEFLYEAGRGPEPQYRFRHALTHEVAYASVPVVQRRRLHAAIAEAVERIYPDRLNEHVERLAHHALHGERWGPAVRYLRESGSKAASRSAHREAVGYFEQALSTLARLPEDDQTLRQGIDLRFQLRNSLQPLADFERIVRHLREAEALATAVSDHGRLGRAYAYLTDYFRLLGDQDRAMETGHRALAIAESLGDVALRVATSAWLGQVYFARGQYREGAVLFRGNVESLTSELTYERLGLPQPPSIHSRTCLVWCLAELGEFDSAIVHGEEAIRIAEADAHPLSLVVAHAGPGILYLRRGDLEEALPHLERALELSADTPLWFPRVASALGAAYAVSGRVAEGLTLLERAIEQAASLKLMAGYSLLLAAQSQAHLAAERPATALELAQQALERARRFKERGNEAWALRILSAALAGAAPPQLEPAAEHGAQALALADELGMRPLVARCHLGLGQVRRRQGERAAAVESLRRAIYLLRPMQMRRWLGEAEAELDALG